MAVVENILNISKVWFRFSKTAKDGKQLKFRWEQLPKHRFEEFIDFRMNYYVKHEFTHCVAGIQKNPEAMKEYRKMITEEFKKPFYYNSICCVDDENAYSKIVAYDSVEMYKKGDDLEYFKETQTAELRVLFKMFHIFEFLCPIAGVLTKYNVNAIIDDVGTAVLPEFRGYSFINEIVHLRHKITKENAVSLTGAWMTSVPVQKATERRGWETVYEIKSDDFEKILGIKLQNAPPKIMYRVKKID